MKLDFTRKNEGNERLKKELGIIGMPTVVLFAADGAESRRFSGFLDAGEFLDLLRR